LRSPSVPLAHLESNGNAIFGLIAAPRERPWQAPDLMLDAVLAGGWDSR
jgi:hypothetical protein